MKLRSFAAAAAIALSSIGIVSAAPASAGVTWCAPGYVLVTVGGVSACQPAPPVHRRHRSASQSGTAYGARVAL
jgi:hypothetical protein